MTKALDAAAIEEVLRHAAQSVGLENHSSDTFWKTSSENSSDPVQLKVYAPLSCKGIRQHFGISMQHLSASFGPRDSFQVTRNPRASRRKDETVVAPSGPYIVRSVSSSELKFLLQNVARIKMHFEDCPTSILPRFYFIFRVDKLAGSRREKMHWILTDNLNHLPLPTRERYDLKGCPFSREVPPAERELPGSVLKDGNISLGKNGLRQFPQVSPWDSRQLLTALEGDLAVLEEINATNYSVYVVVAAPRGEEEDGPSHRGPNRPPQVRLNGEEATLFASLIDILQEWGAKTRAVNLLRIFKGPGKARTALRMAPPAFAARLTAFIGSALHESAQERTKVDEVNWSMAVRTKASLSPESYRSPPPAMQAPFARTRDADHGGCEEEDHVVDDDDRLPTPTNILSP